MGKPNIPSTGKVEGLTYKPVTASAMGLPEPKFSLWTSSSYSPGGAYARAYELDVTYSSAEWGNNSTNTKAALLPPQCFI